MDSFGDNWTRAACLKYIRELGLIDSYTVTKSSKNSLARMTTAHFFFFFRSLLLTYISLGSSSPVSSLCPSSSGLFQRIFDILLLTDALLYGTALLAFVDYLFHSRKQAKGTGSRDAQWTITISTVNRWQKDDRYASGIIYRN